MHRSCHCIGLRHVARSLLQLILSVSGDPLAGGASAIRNPAPYYASWSAVEQMDTRAAHDHACS